MRGIGRQAIQEKTEAARRSPGICTDRGMYAVKEGESTIVFEILFFFLCLPVLFSCRYLMPPAFNACLLACLIFRILYTILNCAMYTYAKDQELNKLEAEKPRWKEMIMVIVRDDILKTPNADAGTLR